MPALLLQLAALVGFPVGGLIAQGVGGGIVGLSVSVLYVGVAWERSGD